MKAGTLKRFTGGLFTASLLAFAMPGQAGEVLLAVHGGFGGSTYGAVSYVDQDDASLTILDQPYNPDNRRGLTGVATDSDGRVFATVGSGQFAENGPRLIEIDPLTGTLIEDIGRLQTSGGSDCWISDLSFHPNDTLYGVVTFNPEVPSQDWCGLAGNAAAGALVTINVNTAVVTVKGRDASLGDATGGIAFAPDGTLYFTPCAETNAQLLTINPSNGNILTSTSLQDDFECYMGLAVRPSDGKLFASFLWPYGTKNVVTLNPSTGARTLVGLTDPEMLHDLTFIDVVFEVGGTVSGLEGSGLVLRNNGGDDLPVNANGDFTFDTALDDGDPYAVTVKTQPSSPSQTCTVSSGSGTITFADVTDVAVVCETDSFTVGGMVSGLAGSGLVLQNNGGDDLVISANGGFTFATALEDLSAYAVTVKTQPSNPLQICTVGKGSGNLGGSNVTNVTVTCATETYSVGGSVSGLSGSGLVLQNNSGDDLPVSSNGGFTFAMEVADLGPYAVTVKTQPSNPSQTCTVSNDSGTIAGADVTDVAISCVTNSFTVGGSVSGLEGSGLVLQNNGGDDIAISGNGGFTFATALVDLSAYAVTVQTQPSGPQQTCTVSNGSGNLAGANVTNIIINCVTGAYSVGGTVSGLAGSGLVLQNSGGDDLAITADGDFTFATPLQEGEEYAVTVKTQPSSPSQTCTVSNGSGTMGTANVTDVAVNCVTDTFTVGGTVSGLEGSGLALQNNGGDDLAIGADGGFTFATALADLSAYAVTVKTQPSDPQQTCTVGNGSDTLAGANVTNILVNCVTGAYGVGGSVSGLAGSGLVLQNNGGDDLAIKADGSFTFLTPLPDSSDYDVTVKTQPSDPTQVCTIKNGTGSLNGASVTNIFVTCVTVIVGFQINPGMTDAWFNDDTAGQGLLIVVFAEQGIVFLAWFTYDVERPDETYQALLGEIGHRWLTAQGPFEGDTATLEVFLTEGGVFDSVEPPAVTYSDDPVGTMTIVWHDCERATLTYDLDPPGVMGEIELRRIVPDNVPLCEALSGP